MALPSGPRGAYRAEMQPYDGPWRWAPGGRRDAVLEVLSYAVQRLRVTSEWRQPVAEILEQLGEACEASRVRLIENHEDDEGRVSAAQAFAWEASGEQPTELDLPVAEVSEVISAQGGSRFGQLVHESVDTLPEPLASAFRSSGAASVLISPLIVSNGWWGTLIVEIDEEVRAWTEGEIDALTAASFVIAGTIANRRRENELLQVRARYQALVEEIPAVLYIDRPGTNEKTLYVSPQVEEILGVTPQEYMQNTSFWIDHLHPEDRERVVEAFEEFYRTGERTVQDYRMIRPDGRVVWIRDLSRTVREPDGSALVEQGVMFDITEQKEAEQRVAYLAYHDPLTGLPNRLMFGEHLELALARAGRAEVAVAVLFMDLDNLKALNDTQGHAAGDELLRQVSGRIQSVMRPTDLLARQSGDEFLVLLGDIDISSSGEHAYEVAEQVAERIEEVFAATFWLQDTQTRTSVSIGISVFPLDAYDKGELLSHADAAMYQAKDAGGGHHKIFGSDRR